MKRVTRGAGYRWEGLPGGRCTHETGYPWGGFPRGADYPWDGLPVGRNTRRTRYAWDRVAVAGSWVCGEKNCDFVFCRLLFFFFGKVRMRFSLSDV